MKNSETLLMVADSEHNADMLYATGLFVPDPFIYLRIRGRHMIVMNDLEIDRAKQQAPHCRAISLSQCQQKLRREGKKSPTTADIVGSILREERVRKVLVPGNFPYALAMDLRDVGIKVKARPCCIGKGGEQSTTKRAE